MAIPDAYSTAWLYYLAANCGLLLMLWLVIRGAKWRLAKISIMSMMVALLFTPFSVDGDLDSSILAPAWLMLAMEGVFEGEFARVGKVLMPSMIIAFIVALLVEVFLRKRSQLTAQSAARANSSEMALERE